MLAIRVRPPSVSPPPRLRIPPGKGQVQSVFGLRGVRGERGMVRAPFETEGGGLTETDGVIEVGAAEEQLHPSAAGRPKGMSFGHHPQR